METQADNTELLNRLRMLEAAVCALHDMCANRLQRIETKASHTAGSATRLERALLGKDAARVGDS